LDGPVAGAGRQGGAGIPERWCSRLTPRERREDRWLNNVVARRLDTWERADRFRAKSLRTEEIPCARENIPCALA